MFLDSLLTRFILVLIFLKKMFKRNNNIEKESKILLTSLKPPRFQKNKK